MNLTLDMRSLVINFRQRSVCISMLDSFLNNSRVNQLLVVIYYYFFYPVTMIPR